MKYTVLLVDDEQHILDSYRRTLFTHYDIKTALSGAEALQILQKTPGIAVIVSDMQMPEMNGVEFLEKARKVAKNAVRIMLTGNADQQTATAAINRGDIFRFLNKPCSPEVMIETLQVAIRHYQLIIAEQELLSSTLKKSIDALVETLSLACPASFGPVDRIKRNMSLCARAMGTSQLWMFEAMAMLALIGYVSLPDEIVNKVAEGRPLTDDQHKAYVTHSEVGFRLINQIPRLAGIANVIRYQNKCYDGSGFPKDDVAGKDIPVGARILKIALDYDRYSASASPEVAIAKLVKDKHLYDLNILKHFIKTVRVSDDRKIIPIEMSTLEVGMIFASHVLTDEGLLLISKGQEVTEGVINRINNFSQNQGPSQKLMIYPPEDEA